MNRFSDEIRIIPGVARTLAALVYVGMYCCLFYTTFHDARWPLAGALAFSLWPGLLVAAVVLLIGYINADARRRGMNYIMWTLLAIFVPNTIGIILYFVLREPLRVPCPKCGAQVRSGFAFCPQCGGQLSTPCPGCKRVVDPAWQRCAYCGRDLKPASPAAGLGTINV
jgi:hypothetical protein